MSAALITGAASGIGRATAERLAADGMRRFVLVDRDAAALDALDISGDILRRTHDVADDAAWAETERQTRERFGGLTHAVVNAGVASNGAIADLDLAEWRRVMAVNLDGTFLTLRAAMRLMTAGSIVVVASASGLKAEPGVAAYGASKAAAIHLAKVAAKEGAPAVRVNAICPGGVETPIWRGMAFFDELVAAQGSERAAFDALSGGSPLGRFATADEIAGQIAFLLSEAAASMTGSALVVDGGYLL